MAAQQNELPPRKSGSDGSYDLTSAGLQERGDQDINKRRNHDAGFKARVALNAVKGEHTVSELAAEYGLQPRDLLALHRIARVHGLLVVDQPATQAVKNGALAITFLLTQAGWSKPSTDFERYRWERGY